MRTLSAAILCLLVTPLFVPPAAAGDWGCHPERYTVISVDGVYYIDIRDLNTEKYLYSVWVYLEAGGNPSGLDRGDDYAELSDSYDTQCGAGLLPPVVDDVIF